MHISKEAYRKISNTLNDPIIEWKTCTVSGTQFPIYASDQEFYKKVSPKIGGESFQMPTPNLCPEERERRRISFRNEGKFYRRICDFSGKEIISTYAPNTDYKVYDQDIWSSDSWNPADYGMKFDFNAPFFTQFDALMKKVPFPNPWLLFNENCNYNMCVGWSKNCYMTSSCDYCEDSGYMRFGMKTKNSYDCLSVDGCENCYEYIFCQDSYSSYFCENSINISNSYYLINCKNCSFCFGCSNVENKNYCIFNQQFSKEEYKKSIQYILKHPEILQKKIQSLQEKVFYKNMNNISCENTMGNRSIGSKNIHAGFQITDSEDIKYVNYGFKLKDVQDGYAIGFAEKSYEISNGPSVHDSSHVMWIKDGPNYSHYCMYCVDNCENLFGCVSLRNSSYHILNTPYSKHEYEQLISRIISHMKETGEWGEFFPTSISPYGYNETIAQENFPLTKEEATERGYKWQNINYDPKIPDGLEDVGKKEDIPKDISTLNGEDVVKKIIICETSGRPFRIITSEFNFYKKHNLSLPTKHPDIRHEQRIKRASKNNLYLQKCDSCEQEMISIYADCENKKVYCEKCYEEKIS